MVAVMMNGRSYWYGYHYVPRRGAGKEAVRR